MGEGAGMIVLESLEHAQKRGAKILCELKGYGTSDDAYHISAPDVNGAGAAISMKHAIEDAGLKTTDIDYINAHGTSTVLNDKSETAAIKTVFGEHAYKVPDLIHQIHDRSFTRRVRLGGGGDLRQGVAGKYFASHNQL